MDNHPIFLLIAVSFYTLFLLFRVCVQRRPLRRRLLFVALFTLVCARGVYQDSVLDEPLLQAVMEGNAPEVKALLERGANPNSHEEGGTSALTLARGGSNTEIVRLLQDAGAQDDVYVLK